MHVLLESTVHQRSRFLRIFLNYFSLTPLQHLQTSTVSLHNQWGCLRPLALSSVTVLAQASIASLEKSSITLLVSSSVTSPVVLVGSLAVLKNLTGSVLHHFPHDAAHLPLHNPDNIIPTLHHFKDYFTIKVYLIITFFQEGC